ncbi:MAG: hypothetical protein HDS39_04415 [Bacteroides sp.]|nr:hypothetical protein [Bacteroides sp.]
MNPEPIGVEINIFASLREAPEHARVEWCEIKFHTFVLVYCKICRNFASQNRSKASSPDRQERLHHPGNSAAQAAGSDENRSSFLGAFQYA